MEKSLMARAVDLLARREYSRRELRERLARHAASPEELERLLDELAERHWQSDTRFAEQFSRARGDKYGSLRLKHEMRERGIDPALISETLAGRDDLACAREVWQRKFGEQPVTPQDKARQIRFLAARGFPLDVIRKVLAGAFDELDP